MKPFALLLVAAVLALAAAGRAVPAGGTTRVVVAYTDGSSARLLERSLGLSPVARIDQLGIDVLGVATARAPDVLTTLRGDPAVRWAELDTRIRALRTPNDPLWPLEWSPRTTQAPAAWDRTVGDEQTVVAVVDTGVDSTQPDLRGRLVPGFDFVNEDADPSDDNGHGTAVAGVVAAAGDNGLGVAGYCWRCRLIAVKVLGADGSGFSSDLARGIVWATDQGARVLNASLGGPVEDAAVAAAAGYAQAHGALVVAAAGNDSSSLLAYPAAIPGVVSVAASDPGDQLYAFSNSGAALAAPGENTTTSLGGGYERFLGTSSAAPVVSGTAGLLLSLVPAATPAELSDALEQSAVPMGGVVYGRVDADRALKALAPAPPSSSGSGSHGSKRMVSKVIAGRFGRTGRRSVQMTTGAGLLRLRFELRAGRARIGLAVSHGRRLVASRSGRRLVRLQTTVHPGRYQILLRAPAGSRFRLLLSYAPPG
jgi:hypothetical protein